MKNIRRLKTDYDNKIKKLIDEISKLEDDIDNMLTEVNEIKSLVYFIKYLKIDLLKLEELGLQRYNAEYGRRISDCKYGLQTTFISEFMYEQLKRFGFLTNERRDTYASNRKN